MAAPFLKVMDSLPCDEKGQESLLETALQAKPAFFVRAMVNKPSQAQIHAFKALGKLHSTAQTHLTCTYLTYLNDRVAAICGIRLD